MYVLVMSLPAMRLIDWF